MDDLQALRALAGGNARTDCNAALEYLYFQWGKGLMGHFVRNGAPGSQAEDVLQDTIEKIMFHAASFRGDTPAGAAAWIWTVARNTLDDYRDRQRKHTRGRITGGSGSHEAGNPDEDGFHGFTDESNTPVSPRGNPDYEYQLGQARACVRRQLRRFARDRARDIEALWLVTQGYTVAEVAERLGKTPNATAVYLTGCRDRIRPWLVQCRRYLDGLAP